VYYASNSTECQWKTHPTDLSAFHVNLWRSFITCALLRNGSLPSGRQSTRRSGCRWTREPDHHNRCARVEAHDLKSGIARLDTFVASQAPKSRRPTAARGAPKSLEQRPREGSVLSSGNNQVTTPNHPGANSFRSAKTESLHRVPNWGDGLPCSSLP